MKPAAIATLAYLATPYSRYPGGLEQAYIEASKLAAGLIKSGLKIYSPIAHCHPIAINGGLDPLDHELWMEQDRAMMEVCGALIVAHMAGWATSKGIDIEVKFFQGKKRPIFDLDPGTMKMVKRR